MVDILHNYLNLRLAEEEMNKMSSLGLAHIGDAVYELMVRTWLCEHGKCTSGGLHKAAVSFVKASKQAAFAQKIYPMLSEEELGVYKRGRNAKVGSVPKNAETGDYHAATGLEALLGYLYLRGEVMRVNELFEIMMEGS